MQLKVIKADGSEEEYLHTKVLATFINALAQPGESNTLIATELADAVTFYLYNKYNSTKISTGEILAIIKAVLCSTGYDFAAENLIEHNSRRQLLRARLQVVKTNLADFSDAVKCQDKLSSLPSDAWNKSKIVNDLVTEHNLDLQTARIIASMVEEKMLASGFCIVPSAFVKFVVITQMQAILSAKKQLLSDSDIRSKAENILAREGSLRQPQDGFCPVEV